MVSPAFDPFDGLNAAIICTILKMQMQQLGDASYDHDTPPLYP